MKTSAKKEHFRQNPRISGHCQTLTLDPGIYDCRAERASLISTVDIIIKSYIICEDLVVCKKVNSRQYPGIWENRIHAAHGQSSERVPAIISQLRHGI